ncbi:MAG: TetR/AcrR family transcriptional regulator [Candidatus Ozemobacteraceae bacterium]
MIRRPKTHRGTKTRERLFNAAAEAFIHEGFHGASVASICRAAKVANGSFYQYFPDKTAAFSAMVEQVREGFQELVTPAQNLEELCNAMFDFFDRYGNFYLVFREAEFLDVTHPRTVFYDGALALIRKCLKVDETTAWAIFGAQTMVALVFGVWPRKPVPARVRHEFQECVRLGIAPVETNAWKDISLPPLESSRQESLIVSKGEQTRRLLLETSRRVFSHNGYASTHISHITEAAGTAQGTFYVHFDSKKAILSEIVTGIREEMRGWVSSAIVGVNHRLEIERRAFLVFLAYLNSHRDIYRIVREAEFAEWEIGRGYYEAIHKAWSEMLKEAMDRGEIRTLDPAIAACILMGAESNAGMRYVLWEKEGKPPAEAVRTTMRFLFNGLGTVASPRSR